MGITITDGFDLKSPQYLDSRQSFETLESMKSSDVSLFPDGFITFCKEDKIHYVLDKETGMWEEFSGAGGGGNNTAPMVRIDENTETMYSDGDSISITYYITDAEGGKMSVKYYINDEEVGSEGVKLGKNTWNIGVLPKSSKPYNLMIKVIDQGQLEGLDYINITVGQLEISSTFNPEVDFTLDEEIVVYYTVDLDDFAGVKVYKTLDKVQDSVDIITKNNEWVIGKLDRGVHEIRLRAVKGTMQSKELKYIITVLDSLGLYMSSTFDLTEAAIDDRIEIDFRISMQDQKLFKTWCQIDDQEPQILLTERGTNFWTVGYLPVGQHTLKLWSKTRDEQISGENQLTFTINISENDYKAETPVVDSSLICWLDAKGKSNNNEETRTTWEDKSGKNTNVILHNLNYRTNGWMNDELVLNGEAYCEIQYKPFENVLRSGVTIDVQFTTRNVGDILGRVISCEQKDSPYNGIYVDTMDASLKVGGAEIKTAISEEETTRITFIIDRISSYMFIYVNAVVCSIIPLAESDITGFTHNGNIFLNAREITDYFNPVGNFGDCSIKNVRVYSRPLGHEEVLKNHISDMKIEDQKIIKDKNYPLRNEGLPVMTLTGDLTPILNASNTKVKVPMDIEFKGMGRDDVIPFFEEAVETRPQGTSTLSYPVKNLKIKLIGEGKGRQIRKNWEVMKTYTLKADFMDSTHANNLGTAKFVEDSKKKPLIVDGVNARIAIDGFPMLVYNCPKKGDTPKFIGVYNFNLDKGASAEWKLDEDNPNHMFYIGGLNFAENGNSNVGTAVGFMDWSNEAINRDWECEFAGVIGNDDKKDHPELSRLIKWVAETNDKTTWRKEMPQYLDVDYTIDYYLNALVLGMVDSLGKNFRIITYDGQLWYPTYYDMDTVLGLDNSGSEKFPSDVEFSSYNTSQSALWTKLKEYMYDEVKDRYLQMRLVSKIYTVDNIMKYYDGEIMDHIGEIYFNREIFEKYMPQGTEYLTMAHGNRKGALKRWIKERLLFVDSLFEAGEEYGKQIIMRLDPGDDGIARFWLKTYSPQYIRVQFGGRTENYWYDKVEKDVASYIEKPIQSNDLEVMINSANEIMSVEGFNRLTMKHLKLNNAVKLTELDVSNNKYLQSLAFDVPENATIKRYLQNLKFKNCTGLLASSKIDLRECVKLKYVDGSDSSVSTVDFPKGGSIKSINLSNTNLVNFYLEGHEYLQSINLSGCRSLNTFTLKDCNKINEISLPNSTITNFVLENCSGIETIDISGSYRISTLKLPYLPNLKEINISNTSSSIRELDLRNSPNIEKIVAKNCSGLRTIKLASNCTSLKHLDVQQTAITDITFGNGSIGNGVDLRSFNMEYINFSNCPNVVTIKLNRVVLSQNSSYIFNNCKKLTRIDGELTLSGSCTDTFFNCAELINFPTIKFDASVTSLYRTFSYCTRITMETAKNILSSCLNLESTNETFSNCLGIKGQLPEDLFAANSKLKSINYTFSNCSIEGTLPAGLFANLDLLESIEYAFNQNKKLTGSVSGELFTNNVKLKSIKSAFYACGLTGQLPANLFINNPDLYDTSYCFANNNLSGQIPETLLSGCRKLTNAEYMFANNPNISGNLPERLFADCEALKNVAYMFDYCEGLGDNLQIPQNLFSGCASLTNINGFFKGKRFTGTIPEGLFSNNANLLTVNELFLNCSELTGTIPENLFVGCESITSAVRVFSGCSKIQTIPNGLFTPFKNKIQSVQEAFSNCLGLIGQLPENIINNSPELSEAGGLFYGCSDVVSEIPGRLFEGCRNLRNISSVFSNCKKLRGAIPENLFADLINVESFSSIFYNCYNLGDNKPIPAGLFANNSNARYIDSVFSGCSKIGGDILVPTDDIPTDLFKNCKNIRTTNSLFYGCTGLAGKIPFGLFQNCDQLISINSTFAGCMNLKGEIPEDLFKGCTEMTSLDYAFSGCSKLTYLPQKLFESCKDTLNKTVAGTFRDCSGLKGLAIPFWNGYNVTSSLECYRNCTGLTDYATIEPTYK